MFCKKNGRFAIERYTEFPDSETVTYFILLLRILIAKEKQQSWSMYNIYTEQKSVCVYGIEINRTPYFYTRTLRTYVRNKFLINKFIIVHAYCGTCVLEHQLICGNTNS